MPQYDGKMSYGGARPKEHVPGSGSVENKGESARRKLHSIEIITTPQINEILNDLTDNSIAQIERLLIVDKGVILAVKPSTDNDVNISVLCAALSIAYNQMNLRMLVNNQYIVKQIGDNIKKMLEERYGGADGRQT